MDTHARDPMGRWASIQRLLRLGERIFSCLATVTPTVPQTNIEKLFAFREHPLYKLENSILTLFHMPNHNIDSVREDLSFVREVVERDGDKSVPWHSRLIWGFFCLVGFIWKDVEPRGAGAFLLYGMVVATGLEIVLNHYHAKRSGVRNRARNRTEIYQSIGFVVVVMVVWALALRRHFSGDSVGQMMLVVVGQYLMISGFRHGLKNGASILGICLLSGALLISFFPVGVWSALGVISAIIIVSGFRWPRS